MLRRRVYLPTAGVTTPRQDFDWAGHNVQCQLSPEPFPENQPPVIAGVSSFGIGGAFGHVVLEEYRPSTMIRASPPRAVHIKAEEVGFHLLPLSAFSPAHLQLYAKHLADYLHAQPDASLRDGKAAPAHACTDWLCEGMHIRSESW